MIEWEKVRAEYVAGGKSQRTLAREYGISASLVGRRAAAEGWKQQRDQMSSVSVAKALDCEAERRAAEIGRLIEMNTALRETLAESILHAEQPLTPRDLAEYARALKTVTETAFRLLGIQTEDEKQGWERLAIERERLELNKKQVDAGIGGQEIRWVIQMADDSCGSIGQ